MRSFHVVGWSMLLLVVSSVLHAQESADELSQAAANPLADLMSFPVQNNTNFGLGPFDRASNVLNIQPVIPLAGGKIITRTILPFVSIPDATSESGTFASGLSDITFTAFYTPPGSGSVTWGVGPVLDVPAGGSERGSEKWSLGPSFVVLAQPGPWTLGVLANNVWSFAGDSDRDSVNKGLLQYFIVRQLGDGMSTARRSLPSTGKQNPVRSGSYRLAPASVRSPSLESCRSIRRLEPT